MRSMGQQSLWRPDVGAILLLLLIAVQLAAPLSNPFCQSYQPLDANAVCPPCRAVVDKCRVSWYCAADQARRHNVLYVRPALVDHREGFTWVRMHRLVVVHATPQSACAREGHAVLAAMLACSQWMNTGATGRCACCQQASQPAAPAG